MIIGIKDGIKLVGISVVACCAVFVCTLFLNFYIDAQALAPLITQAIEPLFDAQMTTAKFVSSISGGCLAVTALVMLVFYVKMYVDDNSEKLGLLKAMGYSDGRLAAEFWVFGLSVLAGAAIGYGLSFIAMPVVYKELAVSGLPVATVRFHPSLLAGLVIAPAMLFAAMSVAYAYAVLRRPVGAMLNGNAKRSKPKRVKVGRAKSAAGGGKRFLAELCFDTLRAKKSTVFFATFACFCFSTMVQMGASMRDLSGVAMGVMVLTIGLVLAAVTLILAVTTLIRANADNIAVMKAFGYGGMERAVAVFAGYIPFAVLGFGVGTAYQYGILKLAVNVFFADIAGMPEYGFDVPVFFITLAAFVVFVAAVTAVGVYKLNRTPVKKIMNAE